MLNLIGGEIMMQNFKDVEELIVHMFEKLDGDETISVVADKDLAVSIMKKLLSYDDVILSFANVDTYDYDREYLVSLHDDTDTDYWYVSIKQIYNYDKDMYFGTDGYVLFHEGVNSKALIDMKNHKFTKLSGYDWFVIGEDKNEDSSEDVCDLEHYDDSSNSESTYINRKKDGTPTGFQKTWFTEEDGISCYSSYSHYSSDVDMLRKIAKEFGINL